MAKEEQDVETGEETPDESSTETNSSDESSQEATSEKDSEASEPQTRGGRSRREDRIRELVSEKKKLESKVEDLKRSHKENEIDEDKILEIVEKKFGDALKRTRDVADNMEIESAMSKFPGAKGLEKEIKKYGETHASLPWSDVVQLVLTKHGKAANPQDAEEAARIEEEASKSQMGGNPNPGSRREKSSLQKTTTDLEKEIREAQASGSIDLSKGIF